MKPDSKFLIVLTGSLGDVVRGFAVVCNIKAEMPEATIGWLIESRWKDLVSIQPLVNTLHVFDRKKTMSSLGRLRRELAAQNYDICLDLQRIFRSGVFSAISGAKRRVGFNSADCKEFNWLFNSEHIPAYGEQLPKIEHYLSFLNYLDLPRREINFGISQADLTKHLPSQLRDRSEPYLAFVMGSSWQSKNWPSKGYVEVIGQLIEANRDSFVLVGEKKHQQAAQEVMSALSNERLINLTGQTSLLELCATIRYARGVVGPDSGPAHLASAFGIPYVTLFGPTSAGRVAPYGNERLQLRSAIPCSPCYRRQCPGLDRLCMRLISPQAVLEKIALI